jgi:F0F1-type ATP synthase membrane subunit b/b'
MATLKAQEHIDAAVQHLEAVKAEILKHANPEAEAHLEAALKHLADARRKAMQKGRAGFYAGQG